MLLVKHMNVAYTTYSLHHCVVLIRVGSAVKRSRTVVFSALRILELLQQKYDSNDSMPRGISSALHYTSHGTRCELSIICTA